MQAFADGKTIEVLNNNGKWEELDDIVFCREPKYYRIKQEPKYRPFNTKVECWQEMQKHQPFGWIRSKLSDNLYLIESVSDNIYSNRAFIPYKGAFESIEFIDGTPFGIKED